MQHFFSPKGQEINEGCGCFCFQEDSDYELCYILGFFFLR